MDSSVRVVTLFGQAGTGKTLPAMAAGLECTMKQKRNGKLLVSRLVILFGKNID